MSNVCEAKGETILGPGVRRDEVPRERKPCGRQVVWLTALFLMSLPFVNPWVRGDGVGYYAYARSLLSP